MFCCCCSSVELLHHGRRLLIQVDMLCSNLFLSRSGNNSFWWVHLMHHLTFLSHPFHFSVTVLTNILPAYIYNQLPSLILSLNPYFISTQLTDKASSFPNVSIHILIPFEKKSEQLTVRRRERRAFCSRKARQNNMKTGHKRSEEGKYKRWENLFLAEKVFIKHSHFTIYFCVRSEFPALFF